jgi:hypothetical protein
LICDKKELARTDSCLNGCKHKNIVTLKNDNHFNIEDVTYILKSKHNYNLYVRMVRPKFSKYPKKRFPAILRLPGGWSNGTPLLNMKLVQKLASKGLIFVAFDSEPKFGPILSEKRNFLGFKDQDDVASVLKSLFRNKNIKHDAVGIWSESNGITLAAGVLGRPEYKDLSKKILFLLDVEGPHCPKELYEFLDPARKTQFETATNISIMKGIYSTQDEYWHERCAINFINNYPGIYQRLQAEYDHKLGKNYTHALAMLNAATTGKAKWTRLNREPKNKLYTLKTLSEAVKSFKIDALIILDILLELYRQ